MAVPPTIPTSFVPHSASADTRRGGNDLLGALGFVAYFIFGISLLAALGMFGYNYVLGAEQSSKDASLTQAESGLDPNTIAHFVRLRDRLVSSQKLLDSHVALSNFFVRFDSIIPKTVRFNSMSITTQDQGQYVVTGTGIANSFNALAATSDALAADGSIKDVIFANISVTPTNTVSFSFTGSISPSLVTFATPGGTSASSTTP